MAEKIKYLMITRNMQNQELAKRLGTTSSNLSGKLRRDNFSEKELMDIACACEATFQGSFILNDTGKEIK
ncbi:MAG: helix-turn-helix domain-containing protein [Evtepia sp.]